MTVVGKAFWNV